MAVSGSRALRNAQTVAGVTTYSYEPATGRLESVETKRGEVTLYRIGYRHNKLDQRNAATVDRLLPGELSSEMESWTYGYDQYDQLSSAVLAGGASYAYAFDAIGNRTETGWVVNNLNQVTYSPAAGSVGYDDRGNVSSIGSFTYKWDARDRLIEAYNPTTLVMVKFGYDADGRRIWKKTYADSELSEHRAFVYDGWNLIGELRVNADETTTLLKTYVWGLDLGGGIGGLLARLSLMPSAIYALRWVDVDFDRGTIRVTCPKLEHIEKCAQRIIPLFPELREHLSKLFNEAASEGAVCVISEHRLSSLNLRTEFERIVERAGLTTWPRLFQNLRASRESELMREYDLATVCKWIGNSPAVAAKHEALRHVG